MRPIRHLLSLLPPTLIALGLAACSSKETPAPAADAGAAPADTSPVVVYCGRSKAMVQGIFDAFTKESGIKVEVRYGDTTALANTVLEEGDASPADLFFAQDAGALGALRAGGRLAALPDALTSQVDARFRAPDNTWIGTSGRARVVAYNTDKLKPEDLPTTIDGFTDPKWKGRIGWPPSNASFQAFVSALRLVRGEEGTLAWLAGIQANEPRVYPKNGPTVQAVANGEIDVAFVNHYYLFTLKKEAAGKPFPVANFHPPGDLGGMMNVAGVGVLTTSKRKENAQKLVAFLLSAQAQKVFAHDNFEYPLAAGVQPSEGIPPLSELKLPQIELGSLSDVEATLKLIRKAGVLP
jgi:iron(III) transport system substrate-binding protein